MGMFHLRQVLSADFLRELAESTESGIVSRDCFYDQLHYVNRRFVLGHFEELAALVVRALRTLHPGITNRDLTYVNDFVAPVNLTNARIHTADKQNKYGWHNDGIDAVLRPCYNLWIPLFRRSAFSGLDERSVFDVLTPATCPRLYDAGGNPKSSFLFGPSSHLPQSREVIAQLLNVPENNLEDYKFFHSGEKMEKIAVTELVPISVVRPTLGDCYVFDSSCFHASGPSDFERIGISIKFLVNNRQYGFRVLPHSALPLGWWGMFICWYDQYRNFSAYENVLETFIGGEQALLEQNADKLECVRDVLLEIARDLGGVILS
jgi:hypothetical protein